jgi:hypothetical protein
VRSSSHATFSPLSVVVAAIRWTTPSWLTSGRPRQFGLSNETSQGAILVPLLVPGGKGPTAIRRPVALASRWSSRFQSRPRDPLLPPPSLAWRLSPRPWSSSATRRWRVACPLRFSSSARLRMLLHVPLRGDSGSPRVTGSITRSRSPGRVVSVSTAFLRPPPGRRRRPPPKGDAPATEGDRFGGRSEPPGPFVEERGEPLESCLDLGFVCHALQHRAEPGIGYRYFVAHT